MAQEKLPTESHSEKEILKCCIQLMHELVGDFQEWYEFIHGEDAVRELPEDERFVVNKTYFHIVNKLFLWTTTHSGGGSTITKCAELGIEDSSEYVKFSFEIEDEEKEEDE